MFAYTLWSRGRWSISIGVSLHLHTDGGKPLMSLYRKLNWLGLCEVEPGSKHILTTEVLTDN